MPSSPLGQWPECSGKRQPPNVIVHEVALSVRSGEAQLRMPNGAGANGLVYSLTSIEPNLAHMVEPRVSMEVPLVRLDSVADADVSFVKNDFESHELRALEGTLSALEQSEPVFLVEAEERHRRGVASSILNSSVTKAIRGLL